MLTKDESCSHQPVVRPKETTRGSSARAHDLPHSFPKQHIQTHTLVFRATYSHSLDGTNTVQSYGSTVSLVVSGGNSNNICYIIQQKNDITALLAKQNISSTLPPRGIPTYDGDPLQYDAFIRAFERGVEKKD